MTINGKKIHVFGFDITPGIHASVFTFGFGSKTVTIYVEEYAQFLGYKISHLPVASFLRLMGHRFRCFKSHEMYPSSLV